ncbi:flippase [Patescibacteria group bacterium]|nr:flippase [Patescibacteria group bacterium]MBU1448503.1 flippase [Patescibacteria group bacterium]MBU2613481.1 flippase [Patescibacteria group bacterium]
MPYGARIAKNALLLTLATAGQKVVAFVAFTIVARLIGREMTGTYFYAISITSIFVTFMDLGMTPVVIRALAGNRDDGMRLFSAAVRAKIFLAPLAILAALLYALAFGADRVTIATVAVACLVMTADTIHLLLYGTLRGKQNLRPESIGMFVGQILTATASVGAAWYGFGPVGLAVALLVGSVWNVVWSAYRSRSFGVRLLVPHRKDFRRLAFEALPFGIAGIAVKVYSYVDSLFLHIFHGASSVGIYAVAYKLTYALQFLPLTFVAALYPALASAYAKKEKTDLRNTFLGSLRLMAAIGFPLSAGLSALSPKIIPLLYGQDFLGTVPVFSILPWVLLPIFLDFPIGALLNATHRAHLKTTAMVLTMVLNVTLNATLVPTYGPVGAAWAGVVSFWCLYGIGAWFTRDMVGGVRKYLWLTARGLIAAGVSWYAWAVIGAPMHLFAATVFGGSVAVVMGFAVRFVTVDDVARFVRRWRMSPSKVESPHE